MKALPVLALAAALPVAALAAPKPFTADDLVRLDRVSGPSLSADGQHVVFQVRSTDWDNNRGQTTLWRVPLAGGEAKRLTSPGLGAASPAWDPSGNVWFLAANGDRSSLWRVPGNGSEARAIGKLDLDVDSFRLAPDGSKVLFSAQIFPDCAKADDAMACTRERLDARKAEKATGQVYDQLFVRHWDTWADGRQNHLFVAPVGEGRTLGTPVLLTGSLNGNVPSRPFGGSGEYAFSPDGATVYFNLREAGPEEPRSTNFDIYAVPADGSVPPKNLTADNKAWDGYPLPSRDGKTLYWLAMKRPGFEADRFGIMALDLASGAKREIAPDWDHSASGLVESADGKTLYTSSDDRGVHALFAIDVETGKATRLVGDGTVTGFDAGAAGLVVARQDFQHPTDLYRVGADGSGFTQLTHFNADTLKGLQFGEAEFFTFSGHGGAEVQGYVVKPVGFRKGRRYPVAFIIHGGPQGAMNNDFHYRWNPQTYAGQGFAVVTINFHGSTGYGQAFTDSISGDWGGKPLEDLKLGWAAALEKYPFLDGERACALGASYGGYMINWIAGVWNEPWKCLVNHDGVFDKRMMSYATEELWFDEWEHLGQMPWANPDTFEKHNPVNHVKDWRVPMLVIHGQLDYRIPVEQGIAAFSALQRRGIESRFLYFPDENHWVLKPHNSVQWHETVNGWLKRWTGDGR